jgi:hypothetical protein
MAGRGIHAPIDAQFSRAVAPSAAATSIVATRARSAPQFRTVNTGLSSTDEPRAGNVPLEAGCW